MRELFPDFERELAVFRVNSVWFSREYPRLASRLDLSSDNRADPHVERLIQSFALLTARVHKRLDDDFPLITESLLDVLYPHYLRPFPSCSIAHLDLGTSAGQLTAPARVARSTQLNARQAKGVTCKFRTAYDVDLLPIKVVSASYRHGAVAPEGTAKLPVTATAVLSIQLEVTSGQMPLAKLPERLRFFLDAEPSLVSTLREVLCHRTVAWMVQTTPHGPWSGPFKQRPEMVGFGEDEALIDFDERSHPAYRLLTEYFAFPEKFNFIDLPLPKAALSSFLGDQTSDDSEGMSRVFTLHVVLEGLRSDSDQARLLESVTARTFVLGCTPVVNLFQQNADPIRVTHAATEYPVVVDARRAFGYEVHSIDKVFRVKQTPHGESIDEFRPFFSLHHDDLLGQGDSVGEKPPGRYWHTHRDAAVAETSPGYELSMSIVDADFEPAAPQTDTLSIQVTATNRDLPGLLSFGNVGGDLFMEGGSVAREIRLLRKPTPSHQFERGKGSLWRLVSHLSLNHLSLSGRGVDAIKEMLRLYDLPQDAANRRQVDGLIAIEFVPTTAWLIVPKEAVKDFMVEAGHLAALCTALSQAKDRVIDADQALGKIQAQQFPAHTAEDQAKKKLADSEKAYDAAYEAVKNELGDKGYLAGGGNGKDLLELVPLARRPAGQKSKHWAAKWTYVRWDQIKPKVRTEKLNAADKSQAKSFVKDGRIDTHALSKQMSAVSPKLKSEWVLWQDGGFLAPNLQAWAETLNFTANEKDPVQFSAGVQLFRYFVGCGAGLAWKPTEGKIAANINGKAELMLARGEAAFTCYMPGPEGWAWAITGIKSKKEYLIGAMLFKGELKLEAAAGASVAAELGLEVNYSGDKAAIKGARKPRRPKTGGGQRKIHVDQPQAQVSAGAEAFAGVKASGGLDGTLQFRDPEQDSTFSAIASVGPKAEAQAGLGAAANLSIDYDEGKFRIYAKAGLCCGLGVKGELGLEVDAKHLGNFLKYVFHALMNSGFEVLEFVTTRGFRAVTQLHVMMAAGLQDSYTSLDKQWTDFQEQLEREDRRVALMEQVLKNPAMLRFAPPESHGILLYELTRHSDATFAYPSNTGWNTEVLGRRKQAVLTVCRWAQCKSQFENIVQHMHPRGAKGGFKGNLAGLLRFMEIGPLDSTLDDELNAIYARLPVEPPRGYKVAANHTPTFLAQAHMGNAPVYIAMLRELDMPNLGGTHFA